MDGEVTESVSDVLWVGDRQSYFRQLLRQREKTHSLYLHKSLLRRPPNPGIVISNFILPPSCGITRDFDWEVVAYHWWTLGDVVRSSYARFMS